MATYGLDDVPTSGMWVWGCGCGYVGMWVWVWVCGYGGMGVGMWYVVPIAACTPLTPTRGSIPRCEWARHPQRVPICGTPWERCPRWARAWLSDRTTPRGGGGGVVDCGLWFVGPFSMRTGECLAQSATADVLCASAADMSPSGVAVVCTYPRFTVHGLGSEFNTSGVALPLFGRGVQCNVGCRLRRGGGGPHAGPCASRLRLPWPARTQMPRQRRVCQNRNLPHYATLLSEFATLKTYSIRMQMVQSQAQATAR